MEKAPPMSICPACEERDRSQTFTAREMMFGWRDRFDYYECQRCGSVYIAQVPADLARFYPSDYYSLVPPAARSSWIPWVQRAWAVWLVDSRSRLAGEIARRVARKHPVYHWARLGQARFESEILDVGCGGGELLRRMQRYGFTRLSGVDPYVAAEINEPGLRISRAELAAVKGEFDLIMMHHVLEHLAEPGAALTMARERLRTDGRILVRIPIAGSFAYREYGADWYHLDAPRHLCIPSVRGLNHLAQRAGLRVLHYEFDGTHLTFRMSDSYRRDIPAANAPLWNRTTRRHYRRRAARLNREGDGDLGVFVLGAA